MLAKMLCIGLMMQGLAGCSDRDRQPPAAGQAFPLSALDQLTSINRDGVDLQGKTLLINFWATWCAPCREEMPDLQRLSDSLDPERYAVIGVSVDEDGNLIREFLLQYGIRFHNFQDDKQRIASEMLEIRAFPVSFIVSPRGIILQRISGVITWDQKSLENILEQESQAAVAARYDWTAG